MFKTGKRWSNILNTFDRNWRGVWRADLLLESPHNIRASDVESRAVHIHRCRCRRLLTRICTGTEELVVTRRLVGRNVGASQLAQGRALSQPPKFPVLPFEVNDFEVITKR